MNALLIGILGYVLIQLVLGYVVSRRIRTEDDYLLAGRRLGYGLATFSIFATWFGAESCVGAAGAAYADGLAGVIADPFGYGLSLLLLGLFLAAALWKMRLTTIADFFRMRFSPSVERWVAIIMIPTSLLWAGAQIRAFGQVLSSSSNLEVSFAITLAAGVVIVYTVMGGLLADAVTDVVQGVLLIGGLAVLAYTIADANEGVFGVIELIREGGLFNEEETTGSGLHPMLLIAEAWAIPVFGSLLAQESVSRVLASRSPTVARRSTIIAAIAYVCIGLIPVSLGLAGFVLVPGLDQAEQILPALARQYLSPFLYVVFAGALVSAILSTVDSTLLAASALFSHNVLPHTSLQRSERGKILIDRFGVAAMGVVSFLLALSSEGVYDLVKDAASFGSSGIFVVFVFGMYSSLGSSRSAQLTLFAGVASWVIGHYVLGFELSYLASLAVSLITFVFVSRIELDTPQNT